MNELDLAKTAWKLLRKYLNLSEIARSLDLTVTAPQQWEFVPEKYVEEISEFLQIDKSVLRPDLFSKEDDFFRPVPLDIDRKVWGIERITYPGVILARNMHQLTATTWANWLNTGERSLNELYEGFKP